MTHIASLNPPIEFIDSLLNFASQTLVALLPLP